MGELASKLIDELLLVASVFSEFISAELSNSESFGQTGEGNSLVVRISELGTMRGAMHSSSYNLLPVLDFVRGLKLARGPLVTAKISSWGPVLAGD